MICIADYIYYNGELYHAQKKKHKYVARVKIKNGKYRYFYTMDEYKAYKSGGTTEKKEKTSKLKSVSNFFNSLKNRINKIFKKSKKELGKSLSKGKKFIDEVILGKKKQKSDKSIITATKERITKYIAKVKTSSGKYKYFYDSDSYNRYLKRMDYQKNEPKFMKKVPKISADKGYTAEEDMAEINEEYSPYDKDRSYNCRYCSTAYELRCRGYDVQASDYDGRISYTYRADLDKMYENPKAITINESGKEHKSMLNNTTIHKKFEYDSDTVTKAINEHSGKNTRGELAVCWKSGGAHSMVYEVDNKGKITVRDCQTNSVYSVDDFVGTVNQITITRTDNLKLKEGVLKAVEDN